MTGPRDDFTETVSAAAAYDWRHFEPEYARPEDEPPDARDVEGL